MLPHHKGVGGWEGRVSIYYYYVMVPFAVMGLPAFFSSFLIFDFLFCIMLFHSPTYMVILDHIVLLRVFSGMKTEWWLTTIMKWMAWGRSWIHRWFCLPWPKTCATRWRKITASGSRRKALLPSVITNRVPSFSGKTKRKGCTWLTPSTTPI